MLPFCGYNMGDYMAHWVKLGEEHDAAKLPKIYYVNWFRKDADGRFVWPGFGENSRVLKWIVERLEGSGKGVETPIGILPAKDALDTEGLDISQPDLDLLLSVDLAVWRQEASLIPQHLETFGDHMPKALWDEYLALVGRLG
jgi:phosphoenolpyruvate carboxykinase (GTP)